MLQAYRRKAFLLAAISWAGLIFYLSSQPSIETPALFPGQDKLFHLIAFGILGFLAMGSRPPAHTIKQVWQVALAVMLYGILDELHQYWVPGRSADVYDAIADTLGGLLGAWAMYYLAGILSRQLPK